MSPTHKLGNILDLILINSVDRYNGVLVKPMDASDHHLLYFSVKSKSHPVPWEADHTVFSYSRVDWMEL